MEPIQLFSTDLVYEDQATEATGIPGAVIRKWASRGQIRRYGGNGKYSGLGHEYKTMYALPEIQERAATYRPRRKASRTPAKSGQPAAA